MADEIKVKDKDIVVPGEVLATGMGYLPSRGSYRQGDAIIAEQLGLVHVDGKVIKLVPLSGRYNPKAGDIIIAEVIDILMNGWRITTNTAYSAMISLQEGSSDFIRRGADLTQYYDIGDHVVGKITNVTSQRLIDVTLKGPGLRKLEDGRIFEVSANKVPRIIGKAGSMVSMIKQATGCKIVVGQNGLVWIKGEPEMEKIAYEAIKQIEEKSHVSGLTNQIKESLEKSTGNKIDESKQEPDEFAQERSFGGERSFDRGDRGGDRGGRDRRPPRRGGDRRPPRGGPRRGPPRGR